MESSKNPALAIAYSIRRKAGQKMAKGGYPTAKDMNYADGGEVEMEDEDEKERRASMIDPMSVARAVHAKRMALGGEVDDDFLSDEENTALPDEAVDSEDPTMKRKRLLSKAFEMVRSPRTK